jgi:hypothetical protein
MQLCYLKNNKGDRCPVRKNFSDRPYLSQYRNINIMAVKSPKQSIEPIAPPDISTPGTQAIDLEDAIADQLLDDIDWQKVRAALIRKAPQKLFAWLTSGNNTPINISQFPELSALPSSEDDSNA